MRLSILKYLTSVIFASLLIGVIGCGSFQNTDPEQWKKDIADPRTSQGLTAGQSIFGDDGLQLFGSKRRGDDPGGRVGIGVNSHLWRASLDTISFMPLTSADPFGGVIITDWYAPPENPNERFKMTVYILTRTLRADGLRVAVFRQKQKDDGDWVDSAINPSTVSGLENKILERARQLKTGIME